MTIPYGVTFSANERDPRAIPALRALGPSGAGAGTVRVNVAWQDVQPTASSPFDFSVLDRVADAARTEGYDVLILLAYSTTWASTAPATASTRTHYPPRMDPWLAYVRATVTHFKGRAAAWEVWNEPDLLAFWHGSPAQYAQLLARTYDAITALDLAPVLFGGLAMTDPKSTFLHAVLTDSRYLTPVCFDIANFHSYGSANDLRQRAAKVQRELAAVGVGDLPVWITETGASSDPSLQADPAYDGPDGQARWLADVLPVAAGLAETVLWFTLWDDIKGGAQYAKHGLLDASLVAKPAAGAFRALAGVL